jgi:aminopeptidase N
MSPPFHSPFAVKIGAEERLLSLKRPEEKFVFENQKTNPVPSLLRGFSAPVILNYPYTEADLLHLMA